MMSFFHILKSKKHRVINSLIISNQKLLLCEHNDNNRSIFYCFEYSFQQLDHGSYYLDLHKCPKKITQEE